MAKPAVRSAPGAADGCVLPATSPFGKCAFSTWPGLVLPGALATWFTVNTLMPAGNQAFRERVWRQIGGQQIGAGATLNRGPNELSLSELSARIDAMRRAGARADSAVLLRSFYM